MTPELLMCTALARTGRVDGCVATLLRSRDDLIHLGATDAAVEELLEIQFSHWEGAAPEVCDHGDPVVVQDLWAEAGRWPLTTQRAAALPIRALAVMSLRRRGGTIGIFAAYRREPIEFVRGDLMDLMTFAGSLAMVTAGRVGSTREPLLPSSPIGIAVGMAMVRLRLSAPDALAMIRAHAFTHDQTVSALTRALVDGTLDAKELDLP